LSEVGYPQECRGAVHASSDYRVDCQTERYLEREQAEAGVPQRVDTTFLVFGHDCAPELNRIRGVPSLQITEAWLHCVEGCPHRNAPACGSDSPRQKSHTQDHGERDDTETYASAENMAE